MIPLTLALLLSALPIGKDIPDVSIDMLHDEMMSLAGGDASAAAPEAAPSGGYVNRLTADAPFRRARRGILVVGRGDSVRAMEPFKGSSSALDDYASAVNEYASRLPGEINIYCMPVPTSVAFYCPSAAEQYTSSSRKAIDRLFDHLDPRVTPVDIYPTLGLHASEPIYSRTDHHWAPLGAFYAAECFASVAGTPFLPLTEYCEHTIDSYVGTMAKFSADKAVGASPEQFVYYTPIDSASYSVNYVTYDIARRKGEVIGRVAGESEAKPGPFFYNFRGSAAYLTFMGGDSRLTHITTGASTGRRLLILKDSFGNAIPPFLFASFDDIHVVDCRYFNRNILSYIADNDISDILFVNNLTHAVSQATTAAYRRYLTQ